jgi:hypothetical protein
LNRRIKRRFDELDIEIPFPHRTLYLGTGVAGELANIAGGKADRSLLKEVVREVLEEMREQQGGGPATVSAAARPAAGLPAAGQGSSGASSPEPRQNREKGEHESAPGDGD